MLLKIGCGIEILVKAFPEIPYQFKARNLNFPHSKKGTYVYL